LSTKVLLFFHYIVTDDDNIVLQERFYYPFATNDLFFKNFYSKNHAILLQGRSLRAFSYRHQEMVLPSPSTLRSRFLPESVQFTVVLCNRLHQKIC